MARILETERGKQKLIYNGFGYVRRTKISWTCDEHSSRRCPAFVKTAEDVADGGIVQEFGEHTHPAVPLKAEIVAAKILLKRKALQSTAPVNELVAEFIREVDEAVVPHLPTVSSMRRSVQRYRSDFAEENDPRNKVARPPGLDANLRPLIIEFYNNGARLPKEMLYLLRARGYPEPPIRVLRSFIARYKKKNAPSGNGGHTSAEGAAAGTGSPRRQGRPRKRGDQEDNTDPDWNDLDVGVYEETGETASAVSGILAAATATATTYATPTSGIGKLNVPGTGRLPQGPYTRSGSKGLRTSRLIPPYSLPTSVGRNNSNSSLMNQAARLENVAANLSKTLLETSRKKSRWEAFGDYVGKALETLPQDTAWIVTRDIQELLFQAQGDAQAQGYAPAQTDEPAAEVTI